LTHTEGLVSLAGLAETKPRLTIKQSTTTAHNLICSQAVICLPHKSLQANVIS